MLPGLPIRFLVYRFLLCLFLFVGTVCLADPFIPTNGNQVLETLRTTSFDSKSREIRELRARLTSDPTNVTVACQLARLCIDRSRRDADPRYLGRAQAALAPWWDVTKPTLDVLILRATIKQSQHDFTNALSDLNLALKIDSRNPQVWLTRTTILTVLGDYPDARKSCLPLMQLTPGLISLTAAASVTSLNGEAESSCRLLQGALDGTASASADEKVWAATVLAEALQRIGRTNDAEHYFKLGLALRPTDPYLLGAYSDLLLDEHRDQAAVDLLKDDTKADGLLLRLALAENSLTPHPADYDRHIGSLIARFEAGHLRGDFVHQREEARFTLHLLNQPEAALRLAQANWEIQREPADLQILLETCVAAKNPDAAKPVLDFIRTNKVQAVELEALSKQLHQP